jgi:hypothetical protein
MYCNAEKNKRNSLNENLIDYMAFVPLITFLNHWKDTIAGEYKAYLDTGPPFGGSIGKDRDS